jgi:translation elongation factor EF-Ts
MTSEDAAQPNVTSDMIKAVRKATKAGTLDCRQALEATGCDIDKAIQHLRDNGIETPKKVWT